MWSSLVLVLRTSLAWGMLGFLIVLFIFEGLFRNSPPNAIPMLIFIGAFIAAISALSHIRRVRLIDQTVTASTLANRHRRQIELPLDANAAFALIEASIRELPGAERVDSAADSLQVRAKIKRVVPFHDDFWSNLPIAKKLAGGDSQIYATVSPGVDACSVIMICEPTRAGWTDWFVLDSGVNLENTMALGRAISRRVAELRKSEKAVAQQTVTEKELTVAKLNLLHAQVEPHFLYNTLASAQILTRTDPASADQMLGNLITYLRHSLPKTEDTPSTIGVELERTRAYLDIMKIRMGSRLQVQIEVPDYLKPVLFPSMMLQTLVENAIKHGLEPQTGGGTIWILARAHENNVALTVADDGRGFSVEGAGTGIGLRNVRERLRLAYGNTASFGIVANFPNGVAATINVPTTFFQGEQHA